MRSIFRGVAKARCRDSDRDAPDRGEWRPRPPLVDYRAGWPRAWKRAVLLPGWISERRAIEKLTIALSTWFRSRDLQGSWLAEYFDWRSESFLANRLIYLSFCSSKRIILRLGSRIVDFIVSASTLSSRSGMAGGELSQALVPSETGQDSFAQQASDDCLRVLLDLAQMAGASKALRVDLVQRLGAGRARRKPSAWG